MRATGVTISTMPITLGHSLRAWRTISSDTRALTSSSARKPPIFSRPASSSSWWRPPWVSSVSTSAAVAALFQRRACATTSSSVARRMRSSSNRPTAFSAQRRPSPTHSRTRDGSASQSPRRRAGSNTPSRAISVCGSRKWSRTKCASPSATRDLPRGMMAVCGSGSPRGWRNSATTANQSAIAPTADASQNASIQPQAPWPPRATANARPPNAATSSAAALHFMRARAAARGSASAR